jgi:hypothetical protein
MARTTKAKTETPTLELTVAELEHVQHAVEHEQDQHQLTMGRLNPALETAAAKMREFGEKMTAAAKAATEAVEAARDGKADA